MSFGSQESVPPCSITMVLALSSLHVRSSLQHGVKRRLKLSRKTVEGKVSDAIPASFLQTHNDAHVVIDLSAAAKLTRIQHPWLVASCKWTDKLVRSALVWLARLQVSHFSS